MINSLVVFMVEKVVERIGGVFVAGFDKVAVNIAGGAGAGMTGSCGDVTSGMAFRDPVR